METTTKTIAEQLRSIRQQEIQELKEAMGKLGKTSISFEEEAELPLIAGYNNETACDLLVHKVELDESGGIKLTVREYPEGYETFKIDTDDVMAGQLEIVTGYLGMTSENTSESSGILDKAGEWASRAIEIRVKLKDEAYEILSDIIRKYGEYKGDNAVIDLSEVDDTVVYVSVYDGIDGDYISRSVEKIELSIKYGGITLLFGEDDFIKFSDVMFSDRVNIIDKLVYHYKNVK